MSTVTQPAGLVIPPLRERRSIVVPCTEAGWITRLYLETRCPDCNGAYGENEHEQCPHCHRGLVPSGDGLALLVFLREWLP